MKNIIYDNEVRCGGNPVITITREQLTDQTYYAIRDLGTYLYDHVHNYGCGVVTLYIVESKDEDTSIAPTATIEYGKMYVANFLEQRDIYTRCDKCASAILEKIVTSLKRRS